MFVKQLHIPRYFIAICAIVTLTVSALYVHSEWRIRRLKQQFLIADATFQRFLEQADEQQELNETYDDFIAYHTEQSSDGYALSDTGRPEAAEPIEHIEGVSVTPAGTLVFDDSYVFPSGFFEGLTAKEALDEIPKFDAQIAAWNEQIAADKLQMARDMVDIDETYASIQENYEAMMKEAEEESPQPVDSD